MSSNYISKSYVVGNTLVTAIDISDSARTYLFIQNQETTPGNKICVYFQGDSRESMDSALFPFRLGYELDAGEIYEPLVASTGQVILWAGTHAGFGAAALNALIITDAD